MAKWQIAPGLTQVQQLGWRGPAAGLTRVTLVLQGDTSAAPAEAAGLLAPMLRALAEALHGSPAVRAYREAAADLEGARAREAGLGRRVPELEAAAAKGVAGAAAELVAAREERKLVAGSIPELESRLKTCRRLADSAFTTAFAREGEAAAFGLVGERARLLADLADAAGRHLDKLAAVEAARDMLKLPSLVEQARALLEAPAPAAEPAGEAQQPANVA
jgi:hypothetical protein